MSHGVQMGSSGVQLNDQELETPQVDPQGGLETINLNEEVGTTSVVKTSKVRFQPKEDELLIQSWLNISKDPIVGFDQIGDSFWKRIGEAYNKYRGKNSQERNPTIPPRATSFRLQKIFITKTNMKISHLRMHGDY